MLMRHMAEHMRETRDEAAGALLQKASEAEQRSALVRRAVFKHETLSTEKVAEPADANP